jgi:serine/threonine protein kinase/Flp pilus assembly protein TadD
MSDFARDSRVPPSLDDLLGDWNLPEPSTESVLPAIGRPAAGTSRSPLDDFLLTGVHPIGQLSEIGDQRRGPNPWEETRPCAFTADECSSEPPSTPAEYPRPGAQLCGFRLISVIGSGAFARVYLAEQSELAGRLVALKVSKAQSDEPQALARLQHSHIVPIHSVHDDPTTGLRLLCMPYLGGANLEQILAHARGPGTVVASGRSLAQALDVLDRRVSDDALRSGILSEAGQSRCRGSGSAKTLAAGPPSEQPDPHGATRGPVRLSTLPRRAARGPKALVHSTSGTSSNPEALRDEKPLPHPDGELLDPARAYYWRHSFVRAAVWIVARLAEALGHAHARGILHRDLKPSNVLIAADGTPMLLDFNLSVQVAGFDELDGVRHRVGGTLPYMAPEHLQAFRTGSAEVKDSVDERSDVYALGLILYEMLAGRSPFPAPDSRLPLLTLIDRLIEDRRRGACPIRQSDATLPPSLESILRVCLDPERDRRYVSAGQFAEDLRRFLDDRPLAHAPDPSPREHLARWLRRHPGARSSSSIALVALALLLLVGAVGWAIADRLSTASVALQRSRFETEFRECQVRLNTIQGPAAHLQVGLEGARRALAAYDLDGRRVPPNWEQRTGVSRLRPEQRKLLREELSELLILRSRGRRVLLQRTGKATDRPSLVAGDDGDAWLRMAEQIDPVPSRALYLEMAASALASGDESAAHAAEQRADTIQVTSARDQYLLGTMLAAEGNREAAEVRLTRAVTLDPRRFWAWFALGICHHDQGRFQAAAGDFAVCSLLEPRFAWPHLNRGLALAAAGRLPEARIADDRAVELAPDFAQARINRALVCIELDQLDQAVSDLAHARALENLDPRITAAYAEALSRQGQSDSASALFDSAIARAPHDSSLRVARGFSWIRQGRSDLARPELEAALKLDARSARALLGLAHLAQHDDPAAALAQLDAALAIDPSLNDARQLRAVVRARQGDDAASDDIARLSTSPTPRNLFNAACAAALLARRTNAPELQAQAAVLLRRAIETGYPADKARSDPDLAGIPQP